VEALMRNSILQCRKANFENQAHATVSLARNAIENLGDSFIDRKDCIEADSFIHREESMNQSVKRQLNACNAIKAFINVVHEKMKSNNCSTKYREVLKSSKDADLLIDEANSDIHKSLKTIEHLEEDIKRVTRDFGFRTTEFKTEKIFLRKLVQSLEERVRFESARDLDKIRALINVCSEHKLALKRASSRVENVWKLSKICRYYERPHDQYYSATVETNQTNLTELFLMKVSSLEGECQELKALKRTLKTQNASLQGIIKNKSFNHQLALNLRLLKIDRSPSVGMIVQISHQIPQIKNVIRKKPRKGPKTILAPKQRSKVPNVNTKTAKQSQLQKAEVDTKCI
jgi:hypothetical protein